MKEDPDFALAAVLFEMHGDIKVIKANTQQQKELNTDHEKRLRKLERFRYAWPSAAAISALVGVGLLATAVFHI